MFENYRVFKYEYAGRPLVVETGKMAGLANGSALVRYGDTAILACATASKRPRDGIDFLPLSIDFEERLYSVGRIPGSFLKREGRPTEKAILTARVIDRPVRPLFPKDLRNDVAITLTVLSVDHDCSPEITGMIGASIALSISDIPWNGPIGGMFVGLTEEEGIVMNPTSEQRKRSSLELTVAASEKKVVMIEAGAKEVADDVMYDAIMKAHEEIKGLVAFINSIVSEIGKPKFEYPSCELDHDMFDKVFDFCEKDVILVTINYRTGIFGFFAHPWLDRENELGISGNYGTLDQIAALEWIHENIAAFGGNPDNITVFGQSAGSMSTQVLISSPLTEGLIAKAVLQSGISCEDHLLYTPTLEEEERIGEDFVRITGSGSLEELRELSWEELLKYKERLDRENFLKLHDALVLVPNVDGHVLKKTVNEVWKDAEMAPIPTMAGLTLDDLGTAPEKVQRKEYGPLLDECRRWSIVCGKAHQKPAYIYCFSHALPGGDWGANAFHSSELWYVMGTLGRCWRPMEQADYDLSGEMVSAWTNFMKSGEPGGGWEAYTEENPYIQEFS